MAYVAVFFFCFFFNAQQNIAGRAAPVGGNCEVFGCDYEAKPRISDIHRIRRSKSERRELIVALICVCPPPNDKPDLSAVTPPWANSKTSLVGFHSPLCYPPPTPPHPTPPFSLSIFYRRQPVHFTTWRWSKCGADRSENYAMWHRKRDRALLPLKLKDLISNSNISPKAGGCLLHFICWLKRADNSPGAWSYPIS